MSATLALSEPKSFSLRHFLLRYLFLGVPLAIWALAFLLIAYLVTLLRHGGHSRAARG